MFTARIVEQNIAYPSKTILYRNNVTGDIFLEVDPHHTITMGKYMLLVPSQNTPVSCPPIPGTIYELNRDNMAPFYGKIEITSTLD